MTTVQGLNNDKVRMLRMRDRKLAKNKPQNRAKRAKKLELSWNLSIWKVPKFQKRLVFLELSILLFGKCLTPLYMIKATRSEKQLKKFQLEPVWNLIGTYFGEKFQKNPFVYKEFLLFLYVLELIFFFFIFNT